MKRPLTVGLLVLLVLVSGCVGESPGEVSTSTSVEQTYSPEISSTTSSERETSTTTSIQPENADNWEFVSFSTSPSEKINYEFLEGSLSGTNAEVRAVLIDKQAKFVKTSANWEDSPDVVLADNVVFQVGENVHYFEVMSTDVIYHAYRVKGDLFDFLRFDYNRYLGWENGVVRLYSTSLEGYRAKRGVLAYAATKINGQFAIVTADGDTITVTTFDGNDVSSQEEYTFDCPVLYLHPAFNGDEIGGFYMGTTCGLYHVDSNLMYLDSGLDHVSWDIISNDHDEVGAIVVYSEDLNQIVALYYSAEDDDVYHSVPLEVDSKPTAASLSGLYLALLYGDKLYIYELRDDSAYHDFAVVQLPYPSKDVKIVQLDEDLEIGVAWDRGFVHVIVPIDELRGEHTLSIGGEISGGESGGEETETTTSTSVPQEGAETEFEGILNLFDIEPVQFGELWGARVHLKATPDYKNVHDWLDIKAYEPAGLPDAYFAFGKYMVHVTSSFRDYVNQGKEFTKYDVIEVYELPATPRDFTFGRYDTSDIFMAGTDGKLYFIYDTQLDTKEVNGEKVRYMESKGYVSWDIDADGVNSMAKGDYNYFVAWKGDKLYLITYTDDQLYNANEEGLPAVQPEMLQLPEKITAVYPRYYGEGFLIRTETGLYLYDVAGRYGYGPKQLYTLLTNVPGEFAYQWYIGDSMIYNEGHFIWIYLTGKYDSNDVYVPVVEVYPSETTIPGVTSFSIMFNTYDIQMAVGFEGRIAIYNITTNYYYDENDNKVYYLNLTLDQSFNVPFTPDYVYGEDECYCHVHFYANYYYIWAGNDYYVLFSSKHGSI